MSPLPHESLRVMQSDARGIHAENKNRFCTEYNNVYYSVEASVFYAKAFVDNGILTREGRKYGF